LTARVILLAQHTNKRKFTWVPLANRFTECVGLGRSFMSLSWTSFLEFLGSQRAVRRHAAEARGQKKLNKYPECENNSGIDGIIDFIASDVTV
jgi:hypothetical protein